MLVNFRTENFMSFEDMTNLSMTLGSGKLHQNNILKTKNIRLLKFAAIYGANASGKSSFVNSIGISKEIIVNGIKDQSLNDYYNKNSESNIHKNTRFEYEILIKDKIYSYGFSINMAKGRITQEWLYDITKEEIVIFTREQKININYDYLEADDHLSTRISIYAEDIENSTDLLFLTFMNQNKSSFLLKNDNVFSDVFNWFITSLEVILPEDATSDFGLTYHNEEYLEELGEFLQANDTGITKVLVEKSDERLRGIPKEVEKKIKSRIYSDLIANDEAKVKKSGAFIKLHNNIYMFKNEDNQVNMYVVKFVHSDDRLKYRFDEQSDGTRRLIELFSIVSNRKGNKVFVVDELDRSLHPLLTLNFVSSFLANSTSSQLLVTTHEDRLLDLSVLRRDEIWFVEKNRHGNSSLYSLEEFKERFDKNVMNAYLNGRYGATPIAKNYFSSLETSISEEKKND